jgi:hypothetical protein
MAGYYHDNISRLEDIEALLVTAQSIVHRLSDDELQVTKSCIRQALSELRAAQSNLDKKWKNVEVPPTGQSTAAPYTGEQHDPSGLARPRRAFGRLGQNVNARSGVGGVERGPLISGTLTTPTQKS